ncbi:MAG: hypothetical protein ACYS30_15890 [Planctomycetota bacterium]|jgi:hypothetical protein
MSETEKKAEGQKPKTSKLAIVLAVSGVGLILLYLIAILVFRPLIHAGICQSNMRTIYQDLLVYAHDYEKEYPTANKWCDLLLEHPTHSFVVVESFRCPTNKKDRCNYAINPNCKFNSPKDMVLLFETKSGWNQFGGKAAGISLAGRRY